MEPQVIYVFTHDSVFLGEDGPTHQPIEHLTALRAIPNLLVIAPGRRPRDRGGVGASRSSGATGPTLIALTRQKLPALERAGVVDAGDAAARRLRARASRSGRRTPITLIATGSEVGLAVEAAKRLEAAGAPARVVSMPAPQRFLAQDAAWRDAVLPPGGRRVSIEAGATDYWQRFVGTGRARDRHRHVRRVGAARRSSRSTSASRPSKVAARVLEWARSTRA